MIEAKVPSKTKGWRKGRGFSKRELAEAGIRWRERPNWLPFDKRRRTCYEHNVRALKQAIAERREKGWRS